VESTVTSFQTSVEDPSEFVKNKRQDRVCCRLVGAVSDSRVAEAWSEWKWPLDWGEIAVYYQWHVSALEMGWRTVNGRYRSYWPLLSIWETKNVGPGAWTVVGKMIENTASCRSLAYSDGPSEAARITKCSDWNCQTTEN